jgi:hypothetical protein
MPTADRVMTTSSGSPKIHTMLPSRFSFGKRLGDYNLDRVKSRKAYEQKVFLESGVQIGGKFSLGDKSNAT